jgi:predicted amidohydrolase
MDAAKVAAIQFECAVGQKERNLATAEVLVQKAAQEGAKLVCLPELFLTGFDRKRLRDLAEPLEGPSVSRLADVAADCEVWLVAGFAERHENVLYNSAAVLAPVDGVPPNCYRKNYLYGEDNNYFKPGDRPCLIETHFAKIAVTICFDFCFPEYIASLVRQGADLIVHPTAWFTPPSKDDPGYPARRITVAKDAGVALLTANHCGPITSEGDLRGVGYSGVIWKNGKVLAECREGAGIAGACIPPHPGMIPI